MTINPHIRCTVGSKPRTTTSPDLMKPRKHMVVSAQSMAASLSFGCVCLNSAKNLWGDWLIVQKNLRHILQLGHFPNAWVAWTQCNLTAARPCLLLAFRDTGRPRRLSALALMLGTGSGSCTAGKIPGIDAVANSSGLLVPGLARPFFFSNRLVFHQQRQQVGWYGCLTCL